MPILIAIGICTVLAGMSVTSQMATNLQNRKRIAHLDRVEGFYVGELLAWHGTLRKSAGWQTPGKSVASLPRLDYSGLTPEQLPVAPGTPLNVATTSRIAPSLQLIRRVPAGGLMHSSANGDCGYFANQKNRLKVCLASPAVPPSRLAFLLSSGAMDSSENRRTAIWGLDSLGSLVDTFGDHGKLFTNFNEAFTGIHPVISYPIGTDEWVIQGFTGGDQDPGIASKIISFDKKGNRLANFGSGGVITFGSAYQPWPPFLPGPNATLYSFVKSSNETVGVKLHRMDRQGNPDVTFGDRGVLAFRVNDLDGFFWDFQVRGDYKIVTTGNYGSGVYSSRYHSDGTRDNTYGDSGTTRLGDEGVDQGILISINSAGEVFYVFKNRSYLLDPNGTLYSDYTGGRPLAMALPGDCVVQNDFRITCVLQFERLANSQFLYTLVQWLPTGELDENFGTGGTAKITIDGFMPYTFYSMSNGDGTYLISGGSAAGGERITVISKRGQPDNRYGQNGSIFNQHGGSLLRPKFSVR